MKEQEFTLTFEHRESYLYAHIEGNDSFAASLNYLNQIADKTHELELNRVLIHENLTGEISEGEIFDIVMDILPSGTGVKVAFFDENSADNDINDFGQLIGKNRGLDVCIFQSLEAAENWIKHPEA